jgi:hypothetical protein
MRDHSYSKLNKYKFVSSFIGNLSKIPVPYLCRFLILLFLTACILFDSYQSDWLLYFSGMPDNSARGQLGPSQLGPL